MSVYDDEWVFSDDAEPSSLSTGTRISEDVHQFVLRDPNKGIYPFGSGMPKYIHFIITTLPTSDGSATINTQFVTASDAALSADVGVIYESGVLDYTDDYYQVALSHFFSLNPDDSYQEFVGFRWVIAGADLTAFKTFAALSDHKPIRREFADARVFGF